MPRRQRETRSPRWFGVRLSAAALVGALVLALTAPGNEAGENDLSVLMADGTLAHDNSRDGAAILSAAQVWPGWSGSGDVAITNTGTAGSWLRLTAAAVDDVPGPAGGRLSDRLQLVVEDVTVPSFSVPVYSGALGAVDERWLGRLEPGEVRSYRFSTMMPPGSGDNAFQASAVSVRFEWAVSDVDPGIPLANPPADPPTDPPADQPTDPPADPPADQPADPPADQPVDPRVDPPVNPPAEIVPDGPPVVEVNGVGLQLRLSVPVTQRPLKRRRLVVLAMCSRRCHARFKASLKRVGSSSRRGVARRTRRMPAGVKVRVKLRLSRKSAKKARRRLRNGRSVRGAVRLVARDRAGNKTRAKQRIRLVPAPR